MSRENNFSISLCMIVKDAEKELAAMWASAKPIVDEWVVLDTGSTDGTVALAKKLGAKVIECGDKFCTKLNKKHVDFYAKYGVDASIGDRVFHFSNARNESFKHATKDFILWLDADDLLVGSRALQRIVNSNLEKGKNIGIHMLYKYEVDACGTPIVEHYRERIVPNDGNYKWVGRIHEYIEPEFETQYIRVNEVDSHVLHNVADKNRMKSHERNARALLLDLYEQGDKPDPRTLLQLAEALRHTESPRVIELYNKFLDLSRWDEERCVAATSLSTLYLTKKDCASALEAGFRAVKERPDFPCGYSSLAQTYYLLDDFENAERFAKLALDTEQPDTVVFVNQKHNKFIPLYVLAEVFLHTNRYVDCLKVLRNAIEYEPRNEDLRRIKFTAEKMIREGEVLKALGKLTEYLAECGEIDKALRVVRDAPEELSDDPRIHGIREELQSRMSKVAKDELAVTTDPNNPPPELQMFVKDAGSFGCKSVAVLGFDAGTVEYIKSAGFKVSTKPKASDAVLSDSAVVDSSISLASKLFAVISPIRSSGGLISARYLREELLKHAPVVWNSVPINGERIYASAVMGVTPLNDITFFCGESFEIWGPLSHVEGGIGGSEEATIYLTRELAKLGHPMTVVNNFPTDCVVDGVHWVHYSSFKPETAIDTLILWRAPHPIDSINFNAKKRVLWLHDVPISHWFTKERLAKLDKIICLSEYHKTLLPDCVPADKVFVSSNGVELSQFNGKVERDPHRVIYTSSYDRGLEHLLAIWPDVIKAVPEATLDIFYGWGTFDSLRTDPVNRAWKSKMMKLIEELPGVTDRGRIDQLSLAREMKSARVFAYPCHFEEISCISAMKSQVAGCIPLTTDYAALAETNKFKNITVKGNPRDSRRVMENFRDALIEILTTKMEKAVHEKIELVGRSVFSWASVASKWSELIREEEYESIK